MSGIYVSCLLFVSIGDQGPSCSTPHRGCGGETKAPSLRGRHSHRESVEGRAKEHPSHQSPLSPPSRPSGPRVESEDRSWSPSGPPCSQTPFSNASWPEPGRRQKSGVRPQGSPEIQEPRRGFPIGKPSPGPGSLMLLHRQGADCKFREITTSYLPDSCPPETLQEPPFK